MVVFAVVRVPIASGQGAMKLRADEQRVMERDLECLFEHRVRARDHELGRILDGAGDLVTLAVVPGRVHGLTSVATQDAALDAIDAWAAKVWT